MFLQHCLAALAVVILLNAPEASGQQPRKIVRLGFLAPTTPATAPEADPYYGEFLRGMRELGYVQGKDFTVDWRFGDGDYKRLPPLAELVGTKPDIIIASTSPAIRAAQQATKTIPIIFPMTGDPVGNRFVASLARPGGNITGISNSNLDVSAKVLELLVMAAPRTTRVGVLTNPGSSTQSAALKSIATAAKSLGIQTVAVSATSSEEIERAFETLAQRRVGAVVIGADNFFASQHDRIARLALAKRLYSISQNLTYALAGGLLSYGTNIAESHRRAAAYVDKILKGTSPAELPVEQPRKFDLFVNVATAKALGARLPEELLFRADKVIE